MMRRALQLLFFLGVLAGPLFSTWAQGPLGPEEAATVERALEAAAAVDSYSSYVEESYSEQTQSLAIKTGGETLQEFSQSNIRDSLMAIVRGQNPNGFFAQIQNVTEDGENYILQGEFRYVDGQLYASGEIIAGTPPYIFGQGFAALDGLALGDFQVFEPQNFIGLMNGASSPNPFADPVQVVSMTTSVSVSPDQINGSPVETITIRLSPQGMLQLIAQSQGQDPSSVFPPALLQALSDESEAVLTVSIDPQGQTLRREIRLALVIREAPAVTLDPQAPADATVDLDLTIIQSSTYRQVNQVAALVAAPQ
jgi:hypothetical protein